MPAIRWDALFLGGTAMVAGIKLEWCHILLWRHMVATVPYRT